MYKRKSIIFILLFLLPAFSFPGDEKAPESGLKTYQEFLGQIEKLAKQKNVKEQLKYAKKAINRARGIAKMGRAEATLNELKAARQILRALLHEEGEEFQRSIQSAMVKLIPFLVKAGGYVVTTYRSGGLSETTFQTPEGSIRLRLPDDAEAGEIISGSWDADSSVPEDDYVIQVLKIRLPQAQGNVKFILPTTIESLSMELLNGSGAEIVKESIPLNKSSRSGGTKSVVADLQEEAQPQEPIANIEIPHLRFRLSEIVLAGRTLVVTGPLDGDYTTTAIEVNGAGGTILAESGRKLVVKAPIDQIGEMIISIRENDLNTKCRFHNIWIDSSIPKNLLQPGEEMSINGKVQGLARLRKPFSFVLFNKTPASVAIPAGSESVWVAPSQIGSDGSTSFTRTLIGVQASPFIIEAFFDPAWAEGPCEPPE